MPVAKHVTTAEYLEGLRAFVRGVEHVNPYGDKVRNTRWETGWTNASESPVSVGVRERRRSAVGQLMCDGETRFYVSVAGECVMFDTFNEAVHAAP